MVSRARSLGFGGQAFRPASFVAWGLLVSALGCGAPAEDTANVTEPIVGGTTVPVCGFPTAVLANGCSAALIHPRVVLTAAHCVREGIAQIEFGESIQSRSKIVRVSQCVAHPSYSGETDDIGFCVLASDVTGIPAVPVMAPCEASLLVPGAPVVEVGFGQNVPVTSANDGFGVKRFMAATIRDITSRGQIRVTTGNQNGEYLGDSGGPLFFQMPDQTWRVIGDDCCGPTIVSGSTAARLSIYTSVPAHLAWLETTSGIDLTPCHDANGWSSTASCAGFATNPAVGAGAWASNCQGASASPQPTCGGMNGGMGSGGTGGGGTGGQAGNGAGGGGASAGSTGSGSGGSGPGGASSGAGGGALSGTGGVTGGASGVSGGAAGAGGPSQGGGVTGGTGTGTETGGEVNVTRDPPTDADTAGGCACATAPRGRSFMGPAVAFVLLGLSSLRRPRPWSRRRSRAAVSR